MELIVQPADGTKPILAAIERAGETIDIVIFRFDLKPVEKALEAAVKRGVAVRALITHTNSGGDKRLRQLELRMLDAGVTVTRTADDLTRYHGKLLIVDRAELHVYGFNYTTLDVKSGSLGVVVRDRRVVSEALRLFAPFRPVPLFQALGVRGFSHEDREIDGGDWQVIFNSDEEKFYGSGFELQQEFSSQPVHWQGKPQSAAINLPPLTGIVLKRFNRTAKFW